MTIDRISSRITKSLATLALIGAAALANPHKAEAQAAAQTAPAQVACMPQQQGPCIEIPVLRYQRGNLIIPEYDVHGVRADGSSEDIGQYGVIKGMPDGQQLGTVTLSNGRTVPAWVGDAYINNKGRKVKVDADVYEKLLFFTGSAENGLVLPAGVTGEVVTVNGRRAISVDTEALYNAGTGPSPEHDARANMFRVGKINGVDCRNDLRGFIEVYKMPEPERIEVPVATPAPAPITRLFVEEYEQEVNVIPGRPDHSQLDLGIGYLSEKMTAPDISGRFKAFGPVLKYTYSTSDNFLHVDAGSFGTLIDADYKETINGVTTEGDGQRSYVRAEGLHAVAGPAAIGLGLDIEHFGLDEAFDDREEITMYTSGRAGALFARENIRAVLSGGLGFYNVDRSHGNNMTGPAWDISGNAAAMLGDFELSGKASYLDYDIDGAGCCGEAEREGHRILAGPQLKYLGFGGNVGPFVAGNYHYDTYAGTEIDPRKGWTLSVGFGFKFGGSDEERIVGPRRPVGQRREISGNQMNYVPPSTMQAPVVSPIPAAAPTEPSTAYNGAADRLRPNVNSLLFSPYKLP